MSKLEHCLGVILQIEGGWANVPGDKGGPTNHGITQTLYNAYRDKKGLPRKSVRLIPAAEVPDVYRVMVWDPAQCEGLSPACALVVFDAATHGGVPYAIRMAQRVLGVACDGVYGPVTAQAFAKMPHKEFVLGFCYRRYQQLMKQAEEPSQQKFKIGWQNRILKVKLTALKWLKEQPDAN